MNSPQKCIVCGSHFEVDARNQYRHSCCRRQRVSGPVRRILSERGVKESKLLKQIDGQPWPQVGFSRLHVNLKPIRIRKILWL